MEGSEAASSHSRSRRRARRIRVLPQCRESGRKVGALASVADGVALDVIQAPNWSLESCAGVVLPSSPDIRWLRRPRFRRQFEAFELESGARRCSRPVSSSPRLSAACQASAGKTAWGCSPRTRSGPSVRRSTGPSPRAAEFEQQRRACVEVPHLGGIDPVPVRALAARQQEIDRGRGRAAAVDAPGVAESLAEMSALGMRLEIEAANYIGGEKHRHRVQLFWTAVASIIQDMTPAKNEGCKYGNQINSLNVWRHSPWACCSHSNPPGRQCSRGRQPDLAVMKRDYRRPPPHTIENQSPR